MSNLVRPAQPTPPPQPPSSSGWQRPPTSVDHITVPAGDPLKVVPHAEHAAAKAKLNPPPAPEKKPVPPPVALPWFFAAIAAAGATALPRLSVISNLSSSGWGAPLLASAELVLAGYLGFRVTRGVMTTTGANVTNPNRIINAGAIVLTGILAYQIAPPISRYLGIAPPIKLANLTRDDFIHPQPNNPDLNVVNGTAYKTTGLIPAYNTPELTGRSLGDFPMNYPVCLEYAGVNASGKNYFKIPARFAGVDKDVYVANNEAGALARDPSGAGCTPSTASAVLPPARAPITRGSPEALRLGITDHLGTPPAGTTPADGTRAAGTPLTATPPAVAQSNWLPRRTQPFRRPAGTAPTPSR